MSRSLQNPLCFALKSYCQRIVYRNTKIKEYLDFGVPVVWLIEPTERKIWIYRANGMDEAAGESIKLDGTDIEVPFSQIFD
jgi:Uma2 family endonuclease